MLPNRGPNAPKSKGQKQEEKKTSKRLRTLVAGGHGTSTRRIPVICRLLHDVSFAASLVDFAVAVVVDSIARFLRLRPQRGV